MIARTLFATFPQDTRFGLRMLGKRPGVTFAAIVCLAIGIAACTTVFSFVESLLLSALPYPQASELAAGLAAFLAAAKLLRSAVYGLGPLGPLFFCGALFLLTATALLACYIAARKILKLEPSVVLR